MIDGLPLSIVKPHGSIGHNTLTLSGSNFWTKVGLGTLTKDARCFTALWSVAGYNMVTRSYACYMLSHAFHDATGLAAAEKGGVTMHDQK